jgi:fructose-1,6-bisphosphatase/inositol monophosphatase family enzyme
MAITRPKELDLLVRMAHTVERGVVQERMSPNPFRVVSMGADGTPTEEVDRIAEAQVLSFLEQEKLDWNLLSEEIGYVHRGGDRVLVLDPIDGSYNVLRGLPLGTVSLALGRETLGDVDVGVVHDIMSGSTYWATRGGGAYNDGRRITTRDWRKGGDLFFLNLNHNSSQRVRGLAARARRIRSLGSASLEISLVAKGSGDLYLSESNSETANLRVTDIAAALLILKEAGGNALRADGSPLEMPLTLKERTSVLAWGRAELYAEGQRMGYW